MLNGQMNGGKLEGPNINIIYQGGKRQSAIIDKNGRWRFKKIGMKMVKFKEKEI